MVMSAICKLSAPQDGDGLAWQPSSPPGVSFFVTQEQGMTGGGPDWWVGDKQAEPVLPQGPEGLGTSGFLFQPTA